MSTVPRSVLMGSETIRTGPTLRSARRLAGLSSSEAARAVGLTRRELRDVERCRSAATVDLVDRALHAYGADELMLPPRKDLVHPDDPTLLVVGSDLVRVDPFRTSDREVLVDYVAAVRSQRGLGPQDPVRFRAHDLVQLAGVLDLTSSQLQRELREVTGSGSDEANRMARSIVLTGLCLAVAGAAWPRDEAAFGSFEVTFSTEASSASTGGTTNTIVPLFAPDGGRPEIVRSDADSSWLARDPGLPAFTVVPAVRFHALAELVVESTAQDL